MGVFQRGRVWCDKFSFAGREIIESSKSRSKTMAKDAEKQRRRELEEGFHNLGNAGEQRIRPLKEIIDEYLVGYVFRNRAPRFPLATAGWRKRRGVRLQHRQLWAEPFELDARLRIRWIWLRGHNGHRDQVRADALAYQTARALWVRQKAAA